jgi:hypothetical protein
MSKAPKIYCPGSAKQISEHLLKLNFPVDELIKLINTHARNGWISLAVSPRKEVGQKGQTHSVWIDTWQPQATPAQPEQAASGFSAMRQAAAEPASARKQDDDVPF